MKKILALFLVLMMVLALCACGGEKPATDTSTDAPATEDTSANVPEDTEAASEEESTEAAATATQIAFETPLTTSFVEMTFTEYSYVEDARQSISKDHVTRTFGPEPVDGKQFILLRGTIKNLNTEELPVYDFFIGEFDLNGFKYEIGANDCKIYDSNGQTASMIEPLSTYDFIMYAAIPNELADKTPTGTFTFGFFDLFDNKDLSYNRSFEEDPISLCPYQYVLNLD